MLLNEEKVVPSFENDESTKTNKNLWYLDNGARIHMTGHCEKFSELNESVTGQVRFGDGSTVKIDGKGTITLKCKNGDEHMLREVYFIPMLCNNIISLIQLSEDGNRVVMHSDFLWVYEENGKLLMNAQRLANRLYKTVIKENVPDCMLTKTEEYCGFGTHS